MSKPCISGRLEEVSQGFGTGGNPADARDFLAKRYWLAVNCVQGMLPWGRLGDLGPWGYEGARGCVFASLGRYIILSVLIVRDSR